jgi:glycosyltransferase involved in cell wall biosynthesis
MKQINILFIAYFYPPLGGPAVQRPVKLIKYMALNNCNVDVLTVKDIQFHSSDHKLLEESKARRIYRADSYDPMSLMKKIFRNKKKQENIYFNTNERTKRIIRKLFPIDDKIAWYYPARKLGRELIRKNEYDYIFATMGPYTSGLIAYSLSREFNIPLIIDYRDHWTLNTNPTNDTYFNMKLSAWFEKKILNHSELTVCVGQQMLDELCSAFGEHLRSKMVLMHNGYEESDFLNIERVRNEKIIIRYVGNFYGHRKADYLVQAIRELLDEGEDLSALQFEFIGNFYKETRELLTDESLNGLIRIIPQVTHDMAVEKIVNADVLMIFIANQDGKGVLTGKLFEYLRSGKMILPMIPVDGEAADILRGLGYSKICQEDDVTAIKKYLLEIRNKTFNNLLQDSEGVSLYSREKQALKLINRLSKRKKRLLHLQLLPLLTGVQNVMLDMFDALDHSEYEIYCTSAPNGPMIAELEKRKIKHIPLKLLYRAINPLDLIVFVQMILLFRRNKIDILHTHSSKTGLLGRFAGYLAGVKQIMHTNHGFAFHDFQPAIVRRIFMFLEKISSDVSDKVVYVNELQMRYAIEHKLICSEKAITIHNAVELKPLTTKDYHPDKIVFGSASRFDKQKNLYNTLKIFIKVCNKNEKLELIIIGDGNEYEKCRKLIEESGMKDRISLPGFRRDRDSFYQKIDVFFLNSLWEGLPLSILEAMSRGIPVLCSDIIGNLDAVDEQVGYLSRVNDAEDFEKKVLEITGNRELITEKGLRAYKRCEERFNMRDFKNKVNQLYGNISRS